MDAVVTYPLVKKKTCFRYHLVSVHSETQFAALSYHRQSTTFHKLWVLLRAVREKYSWVDEIWSEESTWAPDEPWTNFPHILLSSFFLSFFFLWARRKYLLLHINRVNVGRVRRWRFTWREKKGKTWLGRMLHPRVLQEYSVIYPNVTRVTIIQGSWSRAIAVPATPSHSVRRGGTSVPYTRASRPFS